VKIATATLYAAENRPVLMDGKSLPWRLVAAQHGVDLEWDGQHLLIRPATGPEPRPLLGFIARGGIASMVPTVPWRMESKP
jgi:hypothetical protein